MVFAIWVHFWINIITAWNIHWQLSLQLRKCDILPLRRSQRDDIGVDRLLQINCSIFDTGFISLVPCVWGWAKIVVLVEKMLKKSMQHVKSIFNHDHNFLDLIKFTELPILNQKNKGQIPFYIFFENQCSTWLSVLIPKHDFFCLFWYQFCGINIFYTKTFIFLKETKIRKY